MNPLGLFQAVLSLLLASWLVSCAGVVHSPETLDQVAILETRYDLSIVVENVPSVLRSFYGEIKGNDPGPSDLNIALPRIAKALERYPEEALACARIERLVLATDVRIANARSRSWRGLSSRGGDHRGGVPAVYDRALVLDVGIRSDHGQARVLHHEFFHSLEYAMHRGWAEDFTWQSLNPPDFSYGTGGANTSRHVNYSVPISNKPGFLNLYGTTSIHEDKAEIFRWIFTDAEFLRSRCEQDRVLAAKVRLLASRIEQYCPGLLPPDVPFQECSASPEDPLETQGSICSTGALSTDSDTDVVFAIDASQSSLMGSEVDVDRDGRLGRTIWNVENEIIDPNTDIDDSILGLEVDAVRSVAGEILPTGARIGIVSFSGDVDPSTLRPSDPELPHAWVHAELGFSQSQIDAALDSILATGPHGATNLGAAVETGAELLGHPQPTRRRIVIVVTDGFPTLPFGLSTQIDDGDVEFLENAIVRAEQNGIEVHLFGVGTAFYEGRHLPDQLKSISPRFAAVRRPDQLRCRMEATFSQTSL